MRALADGLKVRDRRPTAELAVIVNGRASAAADPEGLLAQVSGELTSTGARVRGHVTRSERELSDALAECDGSRAVLVGGDGTLHAAANAAVPLPELALVPVGRANNVARALGIPLDPAAAARVAATGPALPLDALRVESAAGSRYCLEGLSAGLQADARASYNGANSADLWAGARALAGALGRFRPYRLELSLDGDPPRREEAAQLFLSNLPFFGFGFRVNPAADPADGVLEAVVIRARSRREALALLIDTYRGRHLGRQQVSLLRAREAVVHSPLPLACDSTPLGVSRAAVTVEPGRLRVARPWRP